MPAGSADQVRGYTLRKFLAQGGMAELFLAQPTDPTRSQEIVVVKRVLPQFVQDLQFARMFAREASLASMLKHPNIVEVFDDQGATEAECFFAMEYVHGPDLNMILKQLKEGTRPVPLEHALQIAMGMCQGLHHAHEHRGADGQLLSIVHRDVSPSNVMIAADGTVKITDFGVAKALALTSFTQAGTRKGKLSYMSPEQAVADPVDRRTDIFAIGTVLFEMTTLQRMFGGENELAIMHKLLFRERPRPSAIRHDYPPELESIVLKAVAQKPDDRFDTALDMYEALAAFAERRRLQSTPTQLSRWVGSVIPPLPHPGQDPGFYQARAQATVVPIQRDTVVAGDMQATVSDSGLAAGNATMLDGPSNLSSVAGQLHAAPATQVHAAAASTSGVVPPNGPAFVSPPPTNPGINRRPAKSGSSTLPAIAIVAGALAVGAVILAGALWYADARKRDSAPAASTSEPTKAKAADDGATPAIAEPEPALSPGLVEPEPEANPAAPQPEPAPKVEPEPEAATPVPAPTPQPESGTKNRPSASKTPTKKKRRPKASKPEPEAAPAPRTPQKTPPETAPKPPPKHSVDDLFPK